MPSIEKLEHQITLLSDTLRDLNQGDFALSELMEKFTSAVSSYQEIQSQIIGMTMTVKEMKPNPDNALVESWI